MAIHRRIAAAGRIPALVSESAIACNRIPLAGDLRSHRRAFRPLPIDDAECDALDAGSDRGSRTKGVERLRFLFEGRA